MRVRQPPSEAGAHGGLVATPLNRYLTSIEEGEVHPKSRKPLTMDVAGAAGVVSIVAQGLTIGCLAQIT